MILGVLSDTHGLLRESVLDYLAGVDLIIHGGDMDSEAIVERLRAIAPVHAVRGNVDTGAWALAYPVDAVVQAGGRNFYVVHDRNDLDLDPRAVGMDAVIFGHSHKIFQQVIDGVLYFNPGSAGPRRFSLPISAAKFTLTDSGIDVEVKEFES